MFKLKKSRPVYFSTKEKLILILFDRNIYNLSHFQFVQHFWIAKGEQGNFRNYKLETERTCQIQNYLINNVLTKNWTEKFL